MTRYECAAQLYDLIVTQGRWKGKPPQNGILPSEFNRQPGWVQEAWLIKADEFAAQEHFTFTEA